LLWNRRRSEITLEPYKNIGQIAFLVSRNNLLDGFLACIHLRTLGVYSHPDDPISRWRARQADDALNRSRLSACTECADGKRYEEDATRLDE
jgi:hypothetical protein